MIRISRLCNTINTLRVLLLLYITVITILCCVDYKHPSAFELDQSKNYDIDILSIKPVDCAFSISGQYERTPRFICYLLLVFTVIIRNHEWLATVAAASVMTYSGVAAIHLIILFATNNRLNLPEEKSHCEYQPILGLRSSFVACAGVREPDATLAMILLLTLMLGALPVVAWSATFEKSNAPRKAIFLCWLLLLFLGYTLGTLTVPTRGAHYQICLKDHIEPIATASFQATALDQLWRNSFYSLVSRAQQSSQFQNNGSSPACIYSCFVTPGYIGRKTQDIHVYDLAPLQTDAAEVGLIRIFIMWLYCLHTIFFFNTEFIKNWVSRWTQIGVRWIQPGVQIISVVLFCICIVSVEILFGEYWDTLSQEPFGAIGQWGNLAAVLLVLVATGLIKIFTINEVESIGLEEQRLKDLEFQDWDSRIGYAS